MGGIILFNCTVRFMYGFAFLAPFQDSRHPEPSPVPGTQGRSRQSKTRGLPPLSLYG